MSSVVPDPALQDWVPMFNLAPQQFAYGTSLPASPTDGQMAILVDSITNPSYQWMFRYNAGSSSAYKWEFVGGTPRQIRYDANQNVAAVATYTGLNPILNVTRAGEYLMTISTRVSSPTPSQIYFGVTTDGTTLFGSWSGSGIVSAATGDVLLTGTNLFQALAVGNLSFMGWTNIANTTFRVVLLAILPVRVS